MTPHPWQLPDPLSAIVFDCDGTLTTLEGIDELAAWNGVGAKVATLTQRAMGVTGINPAIFQERLNLVMPTQTQLHNLAHAYYQHRIPDIQALIATLKRFNKAIYIVSAGLNPAVKLFGEMLAIPEHAIFAVDVSFDQAGQFTSHDTNTPLLLKEGKREIIKQIQQQHARILHIGDGLNDFATYDTVTRFVGYGGVFYRDNMATQCDYYIRSPSLAPLLPLSLTAKEAATLTANETALYAKGLAAILAGEVKVG